MDNLSLFVETLQGIMIARNIKPKDIKEVTKISLPVIYEWLKKAAVPKLNSLILLSEYFQCSIDYLCGRTYNDVFVKAANPIPFPERFRFILNKSGVPIRKLSAETKISTSGIQRFLKGTGKPLFDNLIILAAYFGCSIDYLVGREK